MQKILYIPCPMCAHDSSCANSEMWTHGGECGGTLYVDENAYVSCQKCGKKAHISRMRMSCTCGKHHNKVASIEDIAVAASFAKLGASETSVSWLRQFINHL